MGVRKWLAWKLVQLAARLYDAEWSETIIIEPPSGTPLRINITGDEYGAGISSISGIPWQIGPPETAEIGGWKFTWPEPSRRQEEDQ